MSHAPQPALPHASTPERDPRARTTVLVGVIGTILLIAVVLTAQVLFQHGDWIRSSGENAGVNPELAAIRTEQLAPLSQYRWVDPNAGIVAVPLERGIELFLNDLKSGAAPPKIPAPGATQPAAPAGGSATQPQTRPGNAP